MRAYHDAMLARLILLVLLAAFASPAMAAPPCHDAPAAMAMAWHHSTPVMPAHDDKAVVAHSCIGCIPPSSLRASSTLASPIRLPEIRIASFTRLPAGTAPAPATPPPRITA